MASHLVSGAIRLVSQQIVLTPDRETAKDEIFIALDAASESRRLVPEELSFCLSEGVWNTLAIRIQRLAGNIRASVTK